MNFCSGQRAESCDLCQFGEPLNIRRQTLKSRRWIHNVLLPFNIFVDVKLSWSVLVGYSKIWEFVLANLLPGSIYNHGQNLLLELFYRVLFTNLLPSMLKINQWLYLTFIVIFQRCEGAEEENYSKLIEKFQNLCPWL